MGETQRRTLEAKASDKPTEWAGKRSAAAARLMLRDSVCKRVDGLPYTRGVENVREEVREVSRTPGGLILYGRRGEREKEERGKQKKESLRMNSQALQRMATAYSPNWYVSTIGDDAFNFSVRDGKRWVHIAIVTTIYV